MSKVWEKAKKKVRSISGLIESRGDRLIFLPIAVYTVFFSIYMCYMHYVFKTFAWDLGIITQSLWTTLHSGKLLYSTLEVPYGNPSGSFLGVHFSPILFLLLPVYAVFQAPETLLVLQSFILSIAALPIYWIARDKLNSKVYAFGFAVAYLLNPALHGVNTFDFHIEIFTPVFFLLAFYYLEKGNWIRALPFIVLEFLTFEFAPIIVFFLGLSFFVRRVAKLSSVKQRGLRVLKGFLAPTAIMVASVIFFYLAMAAIVAINPSKAGGPYSTWGYWGSNITEGVGNMVRNPSQVLITLFTPIDKPFYLMLLLSSVLFLPILAPLELLMAVPWLLAAFLTNYQPYYSPYFQYSALVIGQLFIAAIFGFQRLRSQSNTVTINRTVARRIVGVMITVNVFLFLTISPVGIPAFTSGVARPYSIGLQSDLSHVDKVHEVLNLIPPDASVATIQDLFPHICQRLNAYFLKWPLDYNVTYILADLKSPTISSGISGLNPDQIIISLLNSTEYGILASMDGVLLLERGYAGPVEYYSPQADVFDYGSLVLGSGIVKWDYTSASIRIISSNPEKSLGMIWFGTYKYFSPGNYTTTFRIKTTDGGCNLVLDIAAQTGLQILASQTVTDKEFKAIGNWQDFSLHFRVDEPTRLEFRGRSISNSTNVALDFVRVEQSNP